MAKPLLGFLTLLPGALVFAAACGGSAFENNAMAGSGGLGAGSSAGASSGGNPSGGTTGIAGSTSVAGSSSRAGSPNGGDGAGGAVGSGGSGGLDVTACKSSSECEVVPASCCSCGTGPVTNFTAINSAYNAQYSMRCGDIACGPCPLVPQNPNNPTLYYVATCSAGHCQVVDLGATPVTACTSASDCTLRSGAACCSGCGGEPVAINKNQEPELEQTVCGSEPVACAACAPSFSGYSAGCTSGRCSVVLTPCTTEHPCPL